MNSTDVGSRIESDLLLADAVRALQAQVALAEATIRDLLAIRVDVAREAIGSDEVRHVAAFLAAELRMSDAHLERMMGESWSLVHRLPRTHRAHRDGLIGRGHVRVIEQAMAPLSEVVDVPCGDEAARDAGRDRIEATLVALAETVTPAQLRRRAQRIVDAALARPMQERHNVAREARGVWLTDAGDGMCDVSARIPAVMGVAIMDRLTQGARQRPLSDGRTIDQWRADAFQTLLLGGEVHGDVEACQQITPVVTVTIPATSLVGDPDTPGLDAAGADAADRGPADRGPADRGHTDRDPADRDAANVDAVGPVLVDGRILVDAATVRRLAADAPTWERLFVDPVAGTPVAVDGYRPSAAQRRWLRLRDGTCRWPGCATSAHRADIDHTADHARGGPTALWNLAHLCRRHHTMKHASPWTVRQLPRGVLEWRSPSGRMIVDSPDTVVL